MAKAGAALGGAAVEAGAAIGAGAMGALQAVMREAAAEARRASEATEEARRARGEAGPAEGLLDGQLAELAVSPDSFLAQLMADAGFKAAVCTAVRTWVTGTSRPSPTGCTVTSIAASATTSSRVRARALAAQALSIGCVLTFPSAAAATTGLL